MKNIDEYMKLMYHLIIQERSDENGNHYFGRIMELDDCMSDGKTIEELRTNIREEMELWLETSIEKGDHIPLLHVESGYSGFFCFS